MEYYDTVTDGEIAISLAACADCPVHAHCLELSLRDRAIGQHGIWGSARCVGCAKEAAASPLASLRPVAYAAAPP